MITSFFAKKETKPPKRKLEAANESVQLLSQRENKKLRLDSSADSLVEKLLESLETTNDEHCWRRSLKRTFESSRFKSLSSFVAKERDSKTVYPPSKDIWSALNLTPIDQVRVVIVGQDPYHGPGQAHGLCFSVLPGQQIPPSLRNIYKELNQDKDITNFNIPSHGHLIKWAKQGVLMINTCMTVRRGEANSHQKRGWELVTDDIIRAVDRHSKATNKGVVFLLWGKPAAAKAQALITSSSKRHHIITTSHPSPLGATKTKSPFMGSKCFSRCNKALVEMGHKPVDWRL